MDNLMDGFGTDLMRMFLAKSWPNQNMQRVEFATWEDVVNIFFSNAKMVWEEAERTGFVWSDNAIEEVDLWLMKMAEAGEFTGTASVTPEAMEELRRRWNFAIIGAELEHEAGNALDLPLPVDAPDELKGFALLLYVLGGPAREYPAEMT